MKKIIIGIIVVIILIVGGVMFLTGAYNNNQDDIQTSTSPSPSPTPTATPSTQPTASVSPTAQGQVKTFVVIGKPFSFTPAQITVNKGDTVIIIFKNESGTHDWRIDEFNAQTKILQAGQEQTIQFIADKVGTFEYYCSIGTHRQMGMKGNLIVK